MFQIRARTYLCILISAMVFVYAYHLRTAGIFACEGTGYSPDRFMAYCNSASYLNYDQGAFWYELEVIAYRNAKDADVLFVGNSKLQFAMSTEATRKWFSAIPENFFLFGFAQYETVLFFSPVFKAMQPRARVFVIHVDSLFEDRITPPMRVISQETDAMATFRRKKLWQPVHRAVCSGFPLICGHEFGLYRDRENGSWLLTGGQKLRSPTDVGDGPPTDIETWPDYAELADQFIAQLPVERNCVLLTLIPSEATRRAQAESIAQALDMPLISPTLDGLRTFDAEHLDIPSSERWSHAFLASAGSRIRKCLEPSRENVH